MATLDIVILAALAFAFYRGYGKGIINRLAAIIGLFLAYNLTGVFFGEFHQYLISQDLLSADSSKYLTYGLTFVLIIVLVKLIGILIVRVLKLLGINFVNKFAGGIVNVLIWGMVLSILVYFAIDLKIMGPKITEAGGILPYMNNFGELLMKKFFN